MKRSILLLTLAAIWATQGCTGCRGHEIPAESKPPSTTPQSGAEEIPAEVGNCNPNCELKAYDVTVQLTPEEQKAFDTAKEQAAKQQTQVNVSAVGGRLTFTAGAVKPSAKATAAQTLVSPAAQKLMMARSKIH
jgi:hypothetical protein